VATPSNSNWFKTFSENWVHPLLENKKAVLILLGLFLSLSGYDIYRVIDEPPSSPLYQSAAKPLPQNTEPQKIPIIQTLDCSKELASHIIRFNSHADSHN